MNRAVDPEEQKWQRRNDARTLAEAEQIKADKDRYAGAQVGANEILQEESQRLKGLSKVAGKKPMKVTEEDKRQVTHPTRISHGALPDNIPDVFKR